MVLFMGLKASDISRSRVLDSLPSSFIMVSNQFFLMKH